VVNSGIGVSKVGNENVGISDGTFAFDTDRPDAALKAQAAQELKQDRNNTSAAISLLNQATAQDSNDAEALIYQEDLPCHEFWKSLCDSGGGNNALWRSRDR